MREMIIGSYQARDVILTFQQRPSAKVRVKLNTYGYNVSNNTSTEYTFKNFEINHERGILSFQFLENQQNYDLKFSEELQNFLNNLVTENKLLALREIGKNIKEELEIELVDPPRFKRKLLQYQKMPIKHFKQLKRVANFSVPGSGKTSIVLGGYDLLKSENIVEKLLVIGPYSSLMPWEDEIKACFNDPIPSSIRIHGNVNKRHNICISEEISFRYEVFLTTYDTASRDVEYLINLLKRYKFAIVLDESHKIKNIDGKTSGAILRLSPYCQSKIVLTGTPVPNTIQDLFSQISFLYPGSILGDKANYKFMTRNPTPSKIEKIKSAIYPFFTRISKSQMSLPSPIEVIIEVPMSPPQKMLYKLVSERFKNIIEMSETLVHFEEINRYKKSLFIRLRQIASNLNLLIEKSSEYNLQALKDDLAGFTKEPETDDEILEVINNLEDYSGYECSPKIKKTVELVKELKGDKHIKKILIWSEFIINLVTLFNYFKEEYGEENVFLIIGDTPKSKAEDIRKGNYTEESREAFISKFKSDPEKFSILIANPQACAESISLHKVCHDAIYVDRSFNCGQFMQSKDRIHRIGLTDADKVTYYYLISTSEDLKKGSIDEKIHNRLMEKELKMLDILNDTESFIGFSNERDAEEFIYEEY